MTAIGTKLSLPGFPHSIQVRSSRGRWARWPRRAWLEANTVDVAIVDFMLKDGPASELARDLNRRSIPFVIYSGYPRCKSMPAELQRAPWLEKPTSRDDLMKVVLGTLVAVSGQTPPTPNCIRDYPLLSGRSNFTERDMMERDRRSELLDERIRGSNPAWQSPPLRVRRADAGFEEALCRIMAILCERLQ
jgi:hypothetical protein